MGFIVLLIMIEGGVVADIFLNRDWKEVYMFLSLLFWQISIVMPMNMILIF